MKLHLFLAATLACIKPSHASCDATSPTGTSAPGPEASPYCPPRPVSPEEQKAILADFVQVFYVEKDINKTAAHFDVNYIQHNPAVLSGRQAFIDAFTAASSSNTTSTTTIVHQALQDNIAYFHYKSETPGSPITAIVDMFRFEESCIMEHWDVIESLPADAKNPLALF
ncbi:snoaL-like polyketide cyclase family protein [Colletotrichum tofieldiae]|uniref:SnoaL-like polyketide cyclase family protein n=1 Tax=Colletotrichum tofieldiae TaxID=708197 RepID=A0A166NPW3_9PEZI|nr:SnoaL-like polyketide cyclase family protein [Colletotrichum tofieldiae]GKT61872.1 SnoaL-like polyketide cyclase family protein [Colletotrichum tofieldiae]GKT70075.1 snoaL-like polyketide cyclase family protein [Colletotrichum tofieldiae]GKT93109.1 snoaL-like polyketide cyclase [Colletotrichum tofieldiae]